MDESRALFTVLVGLVAAQRLAELRRSRRHARATLAAGGYEVGAGHYPAMVCVHVLLLAGAPFEVWGLQRSAGPALTLAAALAFLAGQGLRHWAIAALGPSWSTRVIVLEGRAQVATGPYRWLAHPNYLGVILEVFALPLLHGAWLTSALCGAANLAVLAVRIRVETRALAASRSGDPGGAPRATARVTELSSRR